MTTTRAMLVMDASVPGAIVTRANMRGSCGKAAEMASARRHTPPGSCSAVWANSRANAITAAWVKPGDSSPFMARTLRDSPEPAFGCFMATTSSGRGSGGGRPRSAACRA
eukprot:2627019-Prymnesium_polylepis.1